MLATVLIGVAVAAVAAAFALTVVGVGALLQHRRAVAPASGAATAPWKPAAAPREPHHADAPLTVHLEGRGSYPAEPGVLLNTLWEHLVDAQCQEGECGGCAVRLLEGRVRWVREPRAEVDRNTHVLCCSCEALSSLRCRLPGDAGPAAAAS